MTKEEITRLAEKLVSGTANEEEIILYNRICEWTEKQGAKGIRLSDEEERELGIAIKSNIFHKPGITKVYPVRWLRWSAVAASLILVAGLLWFLKRDPARDEQLSGSSTKSADSLAFVIRHEVNTTGKDKRIQLPDGSLIILADKSEVTYRQPFSDRRDIALTGKADFKVAKDKTKSFVVTSREISTTALGTEFTITAFPKVNRIVVRLYEGKVVINPVNKDDRRMKNEVFLLPGQEFIYNTNGHASVQSFKFNNTATEKVAGDETTGDDPSLPQNARESWYMFNNQGLGNVFDQLAIMYDVKIVYDKKDVRNKYFVGKFNKTDDLEIVLKYIAIANRLKVTKKEQVYIVSK